MTFQEKLEKIVKKNNSLVCVGLDSDVEKIPWKKSQFLFNKSIIEATHDLVCSYKLNIAFYESIGLKGIKDLKLTTKYLKSKYPEIPIIIDAKRGDIGNTNKGYVQFIFNILQADAVTVNPYLGQKAIGPFLERKDKGIIVLCRTSNSGAGEFQDLQVMVRQARLDISQARLDTSQAHHDISQARLDTSQAHHDTSQPHYDTAQAHNDLSQGHHDTSQINHDTAQVHHNKFVTLSLTKGVTPKPEKKWCHPELVEGLTKGVSLPFYQYLAYRIAYFWNKKNNNCLLVVGATYSKELKEVRKIVGENMWFLVPGIGAQGGDLEDALKAGLNKNKTGLIINSSRGIIFAKNPRVEAETLKLKINKFRVK